MHASLKIIVLVACLLKHSTFGYRAKKSINWQGNWAFSCDFRGNDLDHAQTPGEACSDRCINTPECTHFTWTSFNGGTCWMKKGSVTTRDAFSTSDPTMVCGLTTETTAQGDHIR